MNWGTKLVIAMALFMGFIIALSTKMIFSGKDDLVEKDYYEKGLNYDHDYSRKKNTEQDDAEPKIEIGLSSIRLTFKDPSVGTVKFTHAKDRRLDRVFRIDTEDGTAAGIERSQIAHGYWRLTFEWQSKGKQYMFEKGIFIQ